MSYWQFVQAEETENLIDNPSMELGIDGYAAVAGGTLAQSSEQRAVGLYSLKYTPTATTTDGVQRDVTLEAATAYTFSLSIFGVDGVPYRIYLYDVTAGVILGTPNEFLGDGTWRRRVVTATTGANTSCRIYMVKNGSASVSPFYIDAVQVEAKDTATTYCDGDQDGCVWSAGRHSSSSTRSGEQAAGGRVIDLDEGSYLRVQDHVGVGEPPKEIIDTLPAQGDGGDYQRMIVRPRNFQLLGVVKGSGTTGLAARKDYHRKRKRLTQAFNPHRLATEQPVQIRYHLDGKSVAIDSFQEGGLEKGPMEDQKTEKVTLRFKAEDPFWRAVMGTADGDSGGGAGGGQGSVVAGVQQSVANANYIIQRDEAGNWAAMGTGLSVPAFNPSFTIEGSLSQLSMRRVRPKYDGLYLAGRWASIDSVANTRGIVRWDGVQVNEVDGGLDGDQFDYIVDMVLASNGDIYIIGTFDSVNGVANTQYIARLRAGVWESIYTTGFAGSTPESLALSADETYLYVGGRFTSIDGVANTSAIARLNTSTDTWSAMGTGITLLPGGLVRKIDPKADGSVYVSGSFSAAGGVSHTDGLAKWTGAAWQAVSASDISPTGGSIGVAVEIDGSIYVAGSFTQIGGLAGTTRLAKLTLATDTWSIIGVPDSGIADMAVSPDHTILYAVGSFTDFDGEAMSYAAQFDLAGETWSAMGTGLNNIAHSCTIDWDGSLYVTGDFTGAGSISTVYVAKWSGGDWVSIIHATRAIIQGRDGSVYVAGGFEEAGGVADTSRVAQWNPSSGVWAALGTGCDRAVLALAEAANGDLYAAGIFGSAGGVADTLAIAFFDGVDWNPLSTGIDGQVFALAFAANGDLYIGGLFDSAGGVANTRNLARWDGSNFYALSSGADGAVNALAFDSAGNLYIGGAFGQLGAVSCSYIGLWDGSQFLAVGSGTNGFVNSLLVLANDNVILTGLFSQAGGVVVNNMALWNGSQFSSLAGGVNSQGYALAIDENTGRIYVGGAFTRAGGVLLPDRAAVFLGSVFTPLPVNLPGVATVRDLLITPAGRIYVGFDTAGTATAAAVS